MKSKEGQKEWGWQIATYFFLGGCGAGAYAVGVISYFFGFELIPKIGVALGFPLVFIGSLLLLLDLGNKLGAYRVIANPFTSWNSRGAYIISIFMLLGAIHIVTWIWPFQLLGMCPTTWYIIGIVNLIFALLTMTYTGLLLGAAKSIPMWNTPVLPVLFLVSALSTGICGIIFVSLVGGFNLSELTSIIKFNIFLIALEIIIVSLMLKEKIFSALFTGKISEGISFRLSFVVLILFISLAINPNYGAAWFASIIGLITGLLLRHEILDRGVKTPLRTSGIDFTVSR